MINRQCAQRARAAARPGRPWHVSWPWHVDRQVARPGRPWHAYLSWLIVVAISSTAVYGQGSRPIPTQTYFGSFALLHAGEYRDALKGFGSERGIRTPQSRWIDSICYHTMTGECYYKLGQYGEALDSYNAALNLYVAFSNWMASVQFTAVVAPVTNRPASLTSQSTAPTTSSAEPKSGSSWVLRSQAWPFSPS